MLKVVWEVSFLGILEYSEACPTGQLFACQGMKRGFPEKGGGDGEVEI
jgi:hypothetical protein